MSGTQTGRSSTDDDNVIAVIAACLGVGGVVGGAGLLWKHVVAWLIVHQIVVPESRRPVLELPFFAGAGLDWPRICIGVAAVVVVLAVAVSAIRRRWFGARGGSVGST